MLNERLEENFWLVAYQVHYLPENPEAQLKTSLSYHSEFLCRIIYFNHDFHISNSVGFKFVLYIENLIVFVLLRIKILLPMLWTYVIKYLSVSTEVLMLFLFHFSSLNLFP